MDKNSKKYLRTELKKSFYGNETSSTCEKEFRIYGNDKKHVDSSASWIKSGVM